jgi:ADP-ribosylglycohydrolase
MPSLPVDYREKVFAGVLGKIIGVYLGRPFEQWSHERIDRELGEIRGYVHEKLGQPLVVTDDDITGTFTFFRALEDSGYDPNLSPERIGDAWLNYIVENKTILWWGGVGVSTEHTAFVRLQNGIKAPRSGSISENGAIVAEQIGAQIFIDAWGLANPNDPERAADFARRAGSVSHDGNAIYGAQVVAAMIAHSFGERSIDLLLDTALGLIPRDCQLRRMVDDVRKWHAEGLDWRAGLARIQDKWGYSKFQGGCHIIPNHAIVIHALLHGGDSFDESQMVVNTCGYDTDCNAANVGCINGVRLGLDAIDLKWRDPIADRMFLPTADGGRCVSDAERETEEIVRAAHRLRGLPYLSPKNGARFAFSLPNSVQGFEGQDVVLEGTGDGLAIYAETEGFAWTRTNPTAADRRMGGYGLYASPSLYSGQIITAQFAPQTDAVVEIAVETPDSTLLSPSIQLLAGEPKSITWTVPDTLGQPIQRVGLKVSAESTVVLDSLNWSGAAHVAFRPQSGPGWEANWTEACNDGVRPWEQRIKAVQNHGTGQVSTGSREWTDYRVSATIASQVSDTFGIAVRNQGLRQYYAVTVGRDGFARLIRRYGDEDVVLQSAPFTYEWGSEVPVSLQIVGQELTATVADLHFSATDHSPLVNGGAAIVVTQGHAWATEFSVSPA